MWIACEECRTGYETDNPAMRPICDACAAEDRRSMERSALVLRAIDEGHRVMLGPFKIPGLLPPRRRRKRVEAGSPRSISSTADGKNRAGGAGRKVPNRRATWMDDE